MDIGKSSFFIELLMSCNWKQRRSGLLLKAILGYYEPIHGYFERIHMENRM